MTDIYLNEKFIGTVTNAKDYVKQLRTERRRGVLPLELNFYHDEDMDEIYLDTSRGRARRPLIVVEAGKPKLTIDHIEHLKNGEIK